MQSKNILDIIAKIIVLINLSNTYVLLSGVLRIPFQIIGIGSLALLFAFLLLNRNLLVQTLRNKWVVLFLVLFIVLPILSSVIAPMFLLQYVGYQVLAGVLFLTVVVWLLKDGYTNVCRWVLVSLFVGVVGIALSYVQPELFRSAAMLREEALKGELSQTGTIRVSTAEQGRAFGFYMQPNRASFAIAAHFLVLALLLYYAQPTKRLLLLGLCLFAILLTGSRGGFIYAGYAALVLFAFEVFYGTRIRGLIHSGFKSIPRFALFATLGVAVIASAAYIDYRNNPDDSAVIRVLDSVGTLFAGDMKYDTSVEARLIAQEYYIHGIVQSPIWGHGLGGAAYGKYTGSLFLSSHNNFLESAYAYGIPLALAMYIYLAYLAFSRQSREMLKYFRGSLSLALFGYILVSSFITNTVFDYRLFPVVMGICVGMFCLRSPGQELRSRGPLKPRAHF